MYPLQRLGKLSSSHHVSPSSSSYSVISSGCVSGGNDGNANVMFRTAPMMVGRPAPRSETAKTNLLLYLEMS